jgi:hypothetical protein
MLSCLLTLNVQWFLYISPGLTLNNSTLRPRSLFLCSISILCFISISEQTAIISLYSINWFASMAGKERLYWSVGTKQWSIIQVNLSLLSVNYSIRGVLITVSLPPITSGRVTPWEGTELWIRKYVNLYRTKVTFAVTQVKV